jgi:hypothetical protein
MMMVVVMMMMMIMTITEQGGLGEYIVWATGWTPNNFGFVNWLCS